MKPKYKKGDIVKHVLTEEKLLVLEPLESIDHSKCGHGKVFLISSCTSVKREFGEYYDVMRSDYETKSFPEWQLVDR